MKKPYYITTPIYYATDAPHIGHLYTTVAADILARYHRLTGSDVFFLTGTDEHGQKVQKKAREQGIEPQTLVDKVITRYQDAWKVYGVSHDDFIRTTEPRHKKVVTEYIARLMQTGDIYLGEYEGWYCVPDEAYWTETQLVDGNCPDCGRPVEKLKEESYFFRMSAYEKRLLDHIQKNPDFIFPESRKNEVLGFIRQGLKDISVSRTTIQWGIPMPKDSKAQKQHCVYVWFDALTNYISALEPLESKERFDRFWPNAIHLVGKDIIRFHAVYWPTFLMALDLSLPKQIVAHGWLTDTNRKIGKSLGNAVEPIALAGRLGVDSVRYFLFREFVFGLDGEYTEDVLYARINADLANDYGNCLSRVTAMAIKYFGEGAIARDSLLKQASEPKSTAEASIPAFHSEIAQYGFQRALESLWRILSSVNRYIETQAPWQLAKSSEASAQLALKTTLVHSMESLRIVSILLLPFMPESAAKGLEALGLSAPSSLDEAQWGFQPDTAFAPKKIAPLFPRLEKPKG